MFCYIKYLIFYNMCNVMLYNISHVMLCYNICHVVLYNIKYVMLYNKMLCYIT